MAGHTFSIHNAEIGEYIKIKLIYTMKVCFVWRAI